MKTKIQAQEVQGRFIELVVDGLGEIKCLFKENQDSEREEKYIAEVFWNPPECGIVDYLFSCYLDDIEEEIEEIKKDINRYCFDFIEVTCEGRIEDNTDTEEIYQKVLNLFFRG